MRGSAATLREPFCIVNIAPRLMTNCVIYLVNGRTFRGREQVVFDAVLRAFARHRLPYHSLPPGLLMTLHDITKLPNPERDRQCWPSEDWR